MKRDFERRPPRLGRIFATAPLYFVTFCTHERQRFLAKDEVHTAFVLFANRAEETFNVAVGRYVIMPDHIHLFVRGDYNFRLGAWIGALKQALAKAAILSRTKGQVWQEGFFDHLLRTDESYSQKWNYIRENPVRAGLVKLAADWAYQGEIVHIDRA
jgi:putative transposase